MTRVRRRTDADPVRALQRGPQVRDAGSSARPASTPPPSRPDTTRGAVRRRDAGAIGCCAAHDGDKDQSYFPVLADAGSARPRDVSGRPPDQAGGPGARRTAPACSSPTSQTATRSASCPTATRAASWSGGWQTRDQPGEIVDSGGRVLGRHRGLHRLTVGQRKGLGVSTGVPMYVLRLEPAERRVVVGPREELGGASSRRRRSTGSAATPPDDAAPRHRAHPAPPQRRAGRRHPPTATRASADVRRAADWRSHLARPSCSTTATKCSAAAGLTSRQEPDFAHGDHGAARRTRAQRVNPDVPVFSVASPYLRVMSEVLDLHASVPVMFQEPLGVDGRHAA